MTHAYCRRNYERRLKSAFKALIASPASGSLTLPANADIAIAKASTVSANTTVLTVTASRNRTVKVPALAANQIHYVGFFERGAGLAIATGFKVYLRTGLDKYSLIGTA